MNKYKPLTIDYILADVGIGDIDECVRSAISMSMDFGANVYFQFNGKMVKIEHDDLINAVRDKMEAIDEP